MISVRRARARDADGVLACLQSAFEPYRRAYTSEAFTDTVLSPAAIARRFDEMTVFVAVDTTGEVVGTVGCQAVGGGTGHIRGMAVRPDREGSGVGRALLARVEDDLRRRGCSRITLDTTALLTRAIRFYETHGYRPSGVVGDFFGMDLLEYVRTFVQS